MTQHRSAGRCPLLVALVLLVTGCSLPVGGRASESANPAPRASSPSPSPPCRVSPLPTPAPPEAVVVRGCVAAPDGTPARATVVVAHDPGLLETLSTAVNILGTLGLACLAGDACLGPDYPGIATRTDASGQFRIVIPPTADAAQPGTDRVYIGIPSTGVQVETTFKVRAGQQNRDISLRPVQSWDPRFGFTLTASSARARFRALPGTAAKDYQLVVEDRYGSELEVPLGQEGVVNPHLLPPGKGRLWLTHWTATARYRARPVKVAVKDRSVSRGAGCSVTDPAGRSIRPSEFDSCRLADGDWSQGALDPIFVCRDAFASGACLNKSWSLRVDLRRRVTVHDVVLVEPGPNPTVEASPDGRRWTPLAVSQASSDLASTRGSLAVQARYLRIASNDLASIREIAVH